MKNKKGFTLIELLVVISIIALLLSILMPALSKVKEQARITVCKTNLHQWGIAIHTYMSDNDDKMLASTAYDNFGNLFPIEMFLDSASSSVPGTGPLHASVGVSEKEASVFMSQEAIAPYAPGINEKNIRYADGIPTPGSSGAENFELDGIWKCPANNFSLLEFNLAFLSTNRAIFRTNYSYFGRADLFASNIFTTSGNDERRNFPGKDMNGKQLLMSDNLFYWPSPDIELIFNHGKQGASNGDVPAAGNQPSSTLTGVSQLFGDGAVNWKKGSEFDSDLLLGNFNQVEPRITTGIGGSYIYY